MSNADAVEEKNGRAYIYYKKLKENDTTYLAGRFNSKGKFATTYGFLECRMHIVYPEGYQMAFWMMPAQEGGTTPGGIKDGTARDGAEIDIIEGNRQSDNYSCGLHWDGYGDAHLSLWEGRGIHNTLCVIHIHYQQFLEFISLLILQFESLALAECSCFVSTISSIAVTLLLWQETSLIISLLVGVLVG